MMLIGCLAAAAVLAAPARATESRLTAAQLGIVFDRSDANSTRVAAYYARRRGVPASNLVGVDPPHRSAISPTELGALRRILLTRLPSRVQSLLIVWSRPYAVNCMSITTALAAGYSADFCRPGCVPTLRNPLYDTSGWIPADTVGWVPAMLLPSDDPALARGVIDRGLRADHSAPRGTVYLVRTADRRRNVRASEYAGAMRALSGRVEVRELRTPVRTAVTGAIAYFTGAISVPEIHRIEFRPGAAADHLTSTGGVLNGTAQMPILDWLRAGATGSYGTVSEPCNLLPKFPNPTVFMTHYLRGEPLLEAYWKSVAMPGQGLFVGDPLARPYG
ncbi:MAG: TIGR03790 family protein [Gammaproteobacteria bacterium]|nr:TIGR03790 family protein [Gammaproteobacteria bacterium]